ncbi:MAG: hypothetical protein K2N41_00385 [Lachnospiraceae bacterium]|nr:hypothetical protein [Lachnospiraceae bacterium]MDE7238154.1 hypothetical protein [Lachnospiraceae bacterium]
MTTDREELVVEGYRFANMEDADLARLELEKIRAIESRMDYQNGEMVLSVYNRAIMNRTFQTPVGCKYLLKLRDYLLDTGVARENELRAVPLQAQFSGKVKSQEGHRQNAAAGEEKERTVPIWSFRVSLAVNVILMLLVAVMFLIAMSGDNPNILNYKSKILNEYASWEQELRAREREVSGRERELGITPEYPNRVQESEETE